MITGAPQLGHFRKESLYLYSIEYSWHCVLSSSFMRIWHIAWSKLSFAFKIALAYSTYAFPALVKPVRFFFSSLVKSLNLSHLSTPDNVMATLCGASLKYKAVATMLIDLARFSIRRSILTSKENLYFTIVLFHLLDAGMITLKNIT